jgi:hypothetical protein
MMHAMAFCTNLCIWSSGGGLSRGAVPTCSWRELITAMSIPSLEHLKEEEKSFCGRITRVAAKGNAGMDLREQLQYLARLRRASNMPSVSACSSVPNHFGARQGFRRLEYLGLTWARPAWKYPLTCPTKRGTWLSLAQSQRQFPDPPPSRSPVALAHFPAVRSLRPSSWDQGTWCLGTGEAEIPTIILHRLKQSCSSIPHHPIRQPAPHIPSPTAWRRFPERHSPCASADDHGVRPAAWVHVFVSQGHSSSSLWRNGSGGLPSQATNRLAMHWSVGLLVSCEMNQRVGCEKLSSALRGGHTGCYNKSAFPLESW